MSIGKRLKELRKEKGLTQNQLALELNMSKMAVFRYENDQREPNFEAMTKLEKYFKVSSQYLKGESAYRNISEEMFSNDMSEIEDKIKDKPKNIQRMLLTIWNSFNELIEQSINSDKQGRTVNSTHVRLSALASLIDKINTIYFSDYLPMKDLWVNGLLTELEFYKKKELIFNKHLEAVEYFLNNVFTLQCSELYKLYTKDFDKTDIDSINSKDEISRELYSQESYFYPRYFINMENGQASKNGDLNFSKNEKPLVKDKEVYYLPVLGRSAAGSPIEIIEYNHGRINTNGKHSNAFVIQVVGDSMVEAGINDGDYVVVKPQPEVENGEIALVEVEGSSTIKYFYANDNMIELRPANNKMTPFLYDQNTAVKVKGKIVDVIKKSAAEEAMAPAD